MGHSTQDNMTQFQYIGIYKLMVLIRSLTLSNMNTNKSKLICYIHNKFHETWYAWTLHGTIQYMIQRAMKPIKGYKQTYIQTCLEAY